MMTYCQVRQTTYLNEYFISITYNFKIVREISVYGIFATISSLTLDPISVHGGLGKTYEQGVTRPDYF